MKTWASLGIGTVVTAVSPFIASLHQVPFGIPALSSTGTSLFIGLVGYSIGWLLSRLRCFRAYKSKIILLVLVTILYVVLLNWYEELLSAGYPGRPLVTFGLVSMYSGLVGIIVCALGFLGVSLVDAAAGS